MTDQPTTEPTRDERLALVLEYLDELEEADPTPDAVRLEAMAWADRITERAAG